MIDLVLRAAILALVVLAAAGASRSLTRYFTAGNFPKRFERDDVQLSQPGALLVEFTSPYCIECQTALPVSEAASQAYDAPLAVIDAKQRPDLTKKYSIRSTPTILVVDPRGRVTSAWQTSPPQKELHQALETAAAS